MCHSDCQVMFFQLIVVLQNVIFDRWITQDANSIKFPQLLLIPCLFFTCMLGPVGLVIYFSLKNMMGYKTVSKAD
jgi:Domain of unknown function (DUF4281)